MQSSDGRCASTKADDARRESNRLAARRFRSKKEEALAKAEAEIIKLRAQVTVTQAKALAGLEALQKKLRSVTAEKDRLLALLGQQNSQADTPDGDSCSTSTKETESTANRDGRNGVTPRTNLPSTLVLI